MDQSWLRLGAFTVTMWFSFNVAGGCFCQIIGAYTQPITKRPAGKLQVKATIWDVFGKIPNFHWELWLYHNYYHSTISRTVVSRIPISSTTALLYSIYAGVSASRHHSPGSGYNTSDSAPYLQAYNYSSQQTEASCHEHNHSTQSSIIRWCSPIITGSNSP